MYAYVQQLKGRNNPGVHRRKNGWVWLFHDPIDCIAQQAPPSMGFSRQEYRRGLPFSPPGDLPNPGMELASPAWVFYIGRWILYHLSHLGSLFYVHSMEYHSALNGNRMLPHDITRIYLDSLMLRKIRQTQKDKRFHWQEVLRTAKFIETVKWWLPGAAEKDWGVNV